MEPSRPGTLKRVYERTYWVWIVLIVFDLLVQCLRSAQMESTREIFISYVPSSQSSRQLILLTCNPGNTETVVTFILLLEIILRFISDWRTFHKSKRNWVDLVLAIITTILQIPKIHNSGQLYAWLTFFQILRFYRVVVAVSLTRDLLVSKIKSFVSGVV